MTDFSADNEPHEYSPGIPDALHCACGRSRSEMIHRYALLPNPDLAEGLRMYIEEGYMPGHFLTAVLENNLFEAMARADFDNRQRLPVIVDWIFNEAPSACWGSRDKVQAWHEKFWP